MLELHYILKFPIDMIWQSGRLIYLSIGKQISGQQVQTLINYNCTLFKSIYVYKLEQKEQEQNKCAKIFIVVLRPFALLRSSWNNLCTVFAG